MYLLYIHCAYVYNLYTKVHVKAKFIIDVACVYVMHVCMYACMHVCMYNCITVYLHICIETKIAFKIDPYRYIIVLPSGSQIWSAR